MEVEAPEGSSFKLLTVVAAFVVHSAVASILITASTDPLVLNWPIMYILVSDAWQLPEAHRQSFGH